VSEQPGRFRRTWKAFLAGLLSGALALDMIGNGLLGGSFDETISSRAGRLQERSFVAKGLCWSLDKIDKGHCERAAKNKGG